MHGHGHHHGPPGPTEGEGFDQHGNPHDLEAYVARLEDPERDTWQQPDAVVTALGLSVGDTVGEIGAGPGYFTKRLARAVAPTGWVYAVDVDPRILALLRERLSHAALYNVTPVLGLPEDPLLPPGSCDRILVVNALHHFADPGAVLARFARALRPGGILANIDFHKRDTAMGPPLEHRIAREVCLDHARVAGLELASEPSFLEHQYFLLLRRR
jgi:ubiquinone/menaquinone biosynthesis C-methylase UbiE